MIACDFRLFDSLWSQYRKISRLGFRQCTEFPVYRSDRKCTFSFSYGSGIELKSGFWGGLLRFRPYRRMWDILLICCSVGNPFPRFLFYILGVYRYISVNARKGLSPKRNDVISYDWVEKLYNNKHDEKLSRDHVI